MPEVADLPETPKRIVSAEVSLIIHHLCVPLGNEFTKELYFELPYAD